MGSFGVWLAIKSHADYNTGECWPGMRRLADLTGLSLGGVSNAVRTLIDAKLLRVLSPAKGKRGNRYIARERLDVRIGERVLCSVVLDYVPARMRETLRDIEQAVAGEKPAADVWARCEVFPGPGFVWDSKAGALVADVPASEIPSFEGEEGGELRGELVARVRAIQRRVGGPKR